ncbi:MAG: S1C family serine protease [Treponema sp.]|nr:S1C family serine protease [Treponema sp.]
MNLSKIQSFLVKFALGIVGILAVSCTSLPKEAAGDTSALNYEKPDVVKNEIERIKEFLSSNPSTALFRAWLLQEPGILEECVVENVRLAETAFEKQDWVSCLKIAKSFESLKIENRLSFTSNQMEKNLLSDVPGIKAPSKIAASLSDAINATVTIWVDKGIKVSYGTGRIDTVLGSGFFIDERGYIITNHHVIESLVDPEYEGYARLYIKLASDSETKYPAKVIGYDSVMDLALLKTEIDVPKVLLLDNTKNLSAGDKVTVIGSPLGLEASVSQGVISSTERTLFTQGKVLQLDASVNPGNSGGPCIGENLKVQAVVFASVLGSEGLNFAIPVDYLLQELPYLYNGGQFNGEFANSWTGCYGKNRRSAGTKSGVDVCYVIPGTSAVYSGLKKGDVIKECDGKPVYTMEDLQNIFRTNQPGTILNLTVEDLEKGLVSVPVLLEKRPKDPAYLAYKSDLIERSFIPLFGMQMTRSSTNSKKVYKIDWVIPGSECDEAKFSENDTVTVTDVKADVKNKYIYATVYTKRKKAGFLDVAMILSANFDSPWFF